MLYTRNDLGQRPSKVVRMNYAAGDLHTTDYELDEPPNCDGPDNVLDDTPDPPTFFLTLTLSSPGWSCSGWHVADV